MFCIPTIFEYQLHSVYSIVQAILIFISYTYEFKVVTFVYLGVSQFQESIFIGIIRKTVEPKLTIFL